MRKSVIAVCAALAVAVTATPAAAIIGGETAHDQYTWIADLGHDPDGRGCGGGLIAPQWVVTAKHCMPRAESTGKIRIGSNDRTQGGEMAAVEKTVGGNYGDIALVKLSSKVSATPLRVGPMPAGGPVRLLGWGRDAQENPKSPRLLKQLDTTVQGQCGGDDELCVAVTRTATACYGDSGTPAVVNGEVVAVTSRGSIGDCGDAGFVVYTAIAPHQAWIDKTIAAG